MSSFLLNINKCEDSEFDSPLGVNYCINDPFIINLLVKKNVKQEMFVKHVSLPPMLECHCDLDL